MKTTQGRRFALPVIVVLLGAVGFLGLLAGGCGDRSSKAKAQPEHDLETKSADPSTVKPASLLESTELPDLQGRVATLGTRMGRGGLLIVFVDTKCPHAGTAMGDMPTVAATLSAHDIPSVLINVSEPADEVRAFYAARDTGTPVLYDVTTVTQRAWAVDRVPTVVLLDATGQVGYRGSAVWADLARAVEKSLGLADGSVSFEAKGTRYG